MHGAKRQAARGGATVLLGGSRACFPDNFLIGAIWQGRQSGRGGRGWGEGLGGGVGGRRVGGGGWGEGGGLGEGRGRGKGVEVGGRNSPDFWKGC